jgi:hypothetical protein
VRRCVYGPVCRLATACQHHRSGPLDARRRILTPFAGVFPLIDRHHFWATRASRGRALPRIPLARAVVVSSPPGLRSLSQVFSHRPQRTTVEPHPDCTVPRSAPVKATPRRGAVRCGSWLCENSARYDRTRNIEACGYVQSKKSQKFVVRSALGRNQFSFSHSQVHMPTIIPRRPAASVSMQMIARSRDVRPARNAALQQLFRAEHVPPLHNYAARKSRCCQWPAP